MGIVLYVIRQSEVDDVRQVVDIEAARRHVCCHEQLGQMLPELLHRQVTLGLGEVAVERLGVVAVANQLVGNLLRLGLRTAEDDGKDTGIIVHDALQGKVFVLGIHHIIDMVDVLSPLVSGAHHNLLMLMQIVLGDTFHLPAHRRREHQRVVCLWQRLKHLVDIL